VAHQERIWARSPYKTASKPLSSFGGGSIFPISGQISTFFVEVTHAPDPDNFSKLRSTDADCDAATSSLVTVSLHPLDGWLI